MDILTSIIDAEAVIKRDFSGFPEEDVSRAVASNKSQVYYACNSWYAVARGLGVPYGLIYPLCSAIKAVGLRAIVSRCVDFAESYLSGLEMFQSQGEHRFRKECMNAIDYPIADVLDFFQSTEHREVELVSKCLQFLLYLERFTYIGGADEVASLRKFRDVNHRCRDLEYNWDTQPGPAICSMVTDALDELLTLNDWSFDITDCTFSSGSVLEGTYSNLDSACAKSPLAKWSFLAQYRCNVFGLEYPLPGGRWSVRRYRYPRLTLVPKSFTSRRVIAPEDVVMSFYAHGLLESLRRMLNKNGSMSFINEQDQSINRELARYGSQTGYWATVDMSSASDSISKALFFRCCPMWFRGVVLAVISDYVSVLPQNGPEYTMKLFTLLTSGNPFTWLLESCWFLALARVAAALCGDLHPEVCAYVYGDDIVIKAEYYETLTTLLELFGHRVNARKSYVSGKFRESCGGWYMDGYDVTPTFWPRREVKPYKAELAAVLVDLQHKFYTQNWVDGASWITDEVRALFPRITRSSVGSEFGDLWDPECDPYYDSTYRHSRFTSEVKEHQKELHRLADYVAYVEYLLRGPAYISELDHLLGISVSRRRSLLEYATGKVVFKK